MEKEAYQLLKEGRNEEAYQILEDLVRENPTESALFNIALALYRMNQLEEAKTYLEKLLEMNPEHKKGLFLLGVVCRRLGDMECAREAFDRGGFEELKEAIPEPVKREEPELEIPEEPHPEEATTEEGLQPAATAADTDIVRLRMEGKLSIPKEHFLSFIAKEGTIEERGDEILASGEGEVILSSTHLEGEISSDSGEGQLLVDTLEERVVVKVNPDERVFFKNNPRVSWFKQ